MDHNGSSMREYDEEKVKSTKDVDTLLVFVRPHLPHVDRHTLTLRISLALPSLGCKLVTTSMHELLIVSAMLIGYA